jgi:hypothetical protein
LAHEHFLRAIEQLLDALRFQRFDLIARNALAGFPLDERFETQQVRGAKRGQLIIL